MKTPRKTTHGPRITALNHQPQNLRRTLKLSENEQSCYTVSIQDTATGHHLSEISSDEILGLPMTPDLKRALSGD